VLDVTVILIASSSWLKRVCFASVISSDEKKLFKADPNGMLIFIELKVVDVVVLVSIGATVVDVDLIRSSVTFQISFQVFIFYARYIFL